MESNEGFKQKIDYNNCLTNLACSIEKYFDIKPKHKTISELDKLLEEKQPENVVLLLCDGLGSRIMDQILKKDDYLMKKRDREIFCVFPPTTAACLTWIKTGLNPSEHGWVGWTSYVEPINKIITLYKDTEKGGNKSNKDEDFLKIKDKYFKAKTIVDLIKEEGKYKAFETTCYPYNVETNIDNVFNNVLEILTNKKGKKYIFAYYPEPDEILHTYGVTSNEAIKEIENINKKVEEYSKKILETNTIMFITADHGHLIIPNKIQLEKQEFTQYLKIPQLFIESRNPGFLVKEDKKDDFKNSFLKDFSKDFFLLTKEEVLKNKVFGDYEEENKHPLFESSIGNFMAFSKDSSKMVIISECDSNTTSFHGSYNDDEIHVPLIIISN